MSYKSEPIRLKHDVDWKLNEFIEEMDAMGVKISKPAFVSMAVLMCVESVNEFKNNSFLRACQCYAIHARTLKTLKKQKGEKE
jgi:hypothetical protein